jgi:hypothetical protein
MMGASGEQNEHKKKLAEPKATAMHRFLCQASREKTQATRLMRCDQGGYPAVRKRCEMANMVCQKDCAKLCQ